MREWEISRFVWEGTGVILGQGERPWGLLRICFVGEQLPRSRQLQPVALCCHLALVLLVSVVGAGSNIWQKLSQVLAFSDPSSVSRTVAGQKTVASKLVSCKIHRAFFHP